MDSLENIFEKKGLASQLLLRKTLLTMNLNPSEEILQTYFLKFSSLVRELRSTGATLEETDIFRIGY